MVRAESKARQRKFHHKSKGACDRCRARHVRCGQQRPVCDNCRQLGRPCEWQQVLTALVPITLNGDELRSFSWYRENTAAELRGCVDETFWNTALLRLTHESKYLEHLVISMSSLDEAFRLRAVPNQLQVAQRRYAFSLSQYQKGIVGLREDLTSPKEVAIVLASSLVCIAMELWHGDIFTAAQHVMAARKIACDAFSPDAMPASRDSMIGTLLSSLVRYCKQLGPDVNGALRLQTIVETSARAKGDCYHGRFYDLLDRYLAEAEVTPGDQLKEGALRYLDRLQHWYEGIFAEEKRIRRTREYHLFAIHYHAIRAMLIAMITDDEMCFDEHLEDFRQVLAHSSSFLIMYRNSQGEGVMRPRKAPDSTFNMALFLVATKCRHPYVRRQAIRLLYQARRLEGLWSSPMLGVFAEELMTLEEVGDNIGDPPAAIVPPHRRLAVHSFTYEPRILTRSSESIVPESWETAPPSVTLGFTRSHRSVDLVQNTTVHMEPHKSSMEFGMKSIFWWPQTSSGGMLDEEIPASTRSLDGPHLGYLPFWGSVNTDLRSVLYLRFLYIAVAAQPKGTSHIGPRLNE